MKYHSILSEDSKHHWACINTKGKIVLDLGCGRHDTTDLYQSSTIYLGENGASKVIGLDSRQEEINYFNSVNPNLEKYSFVCKSIDTPNDIRELLRIYNPTAIKCDIEGYEVVFYDINKEEMSNITEFYLEYHSLDVREKIIDKINEWGFIIHTEAKFGFVDAPQMGVLFCSKL